MSPRAILALSTRALAPVIPMGGTPMLRTGETPVIPMGGTPMLRTGETPVIPMGGTPMLRNPITAVFSQYEGRETGRSFTAKGQNSGNR